jgi:hypothetical protein
MAAPPLTLFAGLSNGGVITVAGMLVVAKGVVKTGVIARATWRLLARVTTAAQAMRRLIVPVGVASALMNTSRLLTRPRWSAPSRSSVPARTC